MINANRKLNTNQEKRINDLKLGAYLQMKLDHSFEKFGAWILIHFDEENMCFNFGSAGSVPVNKRSLARLTGLPSNGDKIVPQTGRQENVRKFREKLGIPKNEKGFPQMKLLNEINKGNDDNLFVTCWLLLLSDRIFAPDTLYNVSPKLLHICEDVDRIMSYDWVGYILEDIKNSAKHIKEKIYNDPNFSCYMKGSTYFLGVRTIHIKS